MNRVGVFGGSFNPPHAAHLAVARRAMEQEHLDEVLWIPARRPPHKEDLDLADARSRLEMVELATADEPRFRVSDIELERPGPSYTADTLEQLRDMHPRTRYYLIIGEDSLRRLHTWYRPDRVLDAVERILVYRRPDVARDAPVDGMFSGRYTLLEGEPIDVSGTEIRAAIRSDAQNGSGVIPDAVLDYIHRNDLYRPG